MIFFVATNKFQKTRFYNSIRPFFNRKKIVQTFVKKIDAFFLVIQTLIGDQKTKSHNFWLSQSRFTYSTRLTMPEWHPQWIYTASPRFMIRLRSLKKSGIGRHLVKKSANIVLVGS